MNSQEEGVVSASEAGGSTSSATNLAREVADSIIAADKYDSSNYDSCAVNKMAFEAAELTIKRLTEGKVLVPVEPTEPMTVWCPVDTATEEVFYYDAVTYEDARYKLIHGSEWREFILVDKAMLQSHEPISGGEG